jgi:hypothetical protein
VDTLEPSETTISIDFTTDHPQRNRTLLSWYRVTTYMRYAVQRV